MTYSTSVKHVPYPPEQIFSMAQQEWIRQLIEADQPPPATSASSS